MNFGTYTVTFTVTDDHASVSDSMVVTVTDTVVGGNVANIWEILGDGVVRLNGDEFSGVSNLIGGSDSDLFIFENGATLAGTLDGRGGSNTLDFSRYTVGLNANLSDGTVLTATNSPVLGGIANHGIQNVIGGSANDTLVGDDQANVLAGNAGSDNLEGGLGDDAFLFGNTTSGTDTVIGGAGMDTLDFSARTVAGLTLDLSITGSARAIGGGGSIVLSDNLENVVGTVLNDNVTGNSLGNYVVGLAGADQLTGASGDDILLGGDGDDIVVGSEGNDVLVGGFGADRLVGSAGNDVLIAGDVDLQGNLNAIRGALAAAMAQWLEDTADFVSNSETTADDEVVEYYSGDNVVDQLTGSSGADLFIIGSEDQITDFIKKGFTDAGNGTFVDPDTGDVVIVRDGND
jgi:Ca2+-binding RTX toxin-like protein